MPLHDGEIARRDENGQLALRVEPVRLRWTLDSLVTSDGHALLATFTCSARPLPEEAEQRMLEEVFLSRRKGIGPEAVVAHFQPAFRSAAAALCQTRPADQWLSDNGDSPLLEALKQAGKRIAFSCGLDLLPPFHVELSSPTLEQSRIETMQRTRAEQRAAGQVEHVQRATDLLKQFQSLRESAPGLTPGEILRQLAPADQGMVLQTLLLAAAREKTTQAAWAVAGPLLLRIDPRPQPPRIESSPLTTDLGPLRSVQPSGDGQTLLVGAQRGVLRVDAAAPSAALGYLDHAITSQLGFSRALLWADRIWACHSEAGIVCWNISQPQQPAFALRPSDLQGAAPKNLQALDSSRLVFSAGNRLMLLTRSDAGAAASPIAPDARAEIIAILPTPEALLIIQRDGTVQLRNPRTLELQRQDRRSGQVSAAALLPWLGATRLLLATDEGPVLAIGLSDDLVTHYLSPYRGLRALAAAADLIIALSADRQRIILWRPWETRQPAADLFIPTLARHRAADVDL